jgi:ATP-binding cassette subfamily B protein
MQQSIYYFIKRLWGQISLQRRRQYAGLLLLMIVASMAEVLSIGSVIPFLGVITAPERYYDLPILSPLIHFLNIKNPEQLLAPLTLIFICTTLVAGLMRIILIYASTKILFATGSELSINIYRRTLYQPYLIHVSRNSSQVISGITNKVNTLIYDVIAPILLISSSFFMLAMILTAILFIDAKVALIALGGFGSIYLIIIKLTRKRLKNNSSVIASQTTNLVKSLQEGLGGVRDILVDGSQEVYCAAYKDADLRLRRAFGNNQFISQSPRYAMEALGMVLIAALAYILTSGANAGSAKAIPVLGALALGAQRLLPVLQQFYSSWTLIKGGQKQAEDALDLLEQPIAIGSVGSEKFEFQSLIELEGVSFQYSDSLPLVLEGITLKINKGARVGFIGTTGSGKSTLLDILMGLLEPTSGYMKVDSLEVDKLNSAAWQKNIAHVPQSIFLSDATVMENIAFGVPFELIDFDRVEDAARRAKISETIESWQAGYETKIGERGVKLSGGQRQRLGIARALYKQAKVVIFDEATSALDSQTEIEVMDAINKLSRDLTLILIAHRHSTLVNCDIIYRLEKGKITEVLMPNEL